VTCQCSRLAVGRELTEHRNWNPDCPEHGVGSDWYESDEQVAARRRQNELLRDLYARRKARKEQS
jgi:hypothetical protein